MSAVMARTDLSEVIPGWDRAAVARTIPAARLDWLVDPRSAHRWQQYGVGEVVRKFGPRYGTIRSGGRLMFNRADLRAVATWRAVLGPTVFKGTSFGPQTRTLRHSIVKACKYLPNDGWVVICGPERVVPFADRGAAARWAMSYAATCSLAGPDDVLRYAWENRR